MFKSKRNLIKEIDRLKETNIKQEAYIKDLKLEIFNKDKKVLERSIENLKDKNTISLIKSKISRAEKEKTPAIIVLDKIKEVINPTKK